MVLVVYEEWPGNDEHNILGVFSDEVKARLFIKRMFLKDKTTLESIEETEETVDAALIDIHSSGVGAERQLEGTYCKPTVEDYYMIRASEFAVDGVFVRRRSAN